jgi:hypothetical protein
MEQRLTGIEGVAEIQVMPSGDPISFPALHIFDDGHDPEDSDTGGTRNAASPRVEGYVEEAGGAAAYAALDALYCATVRALVTDPPLGGLAETIDEGPVRIFTAELGSMRRLSFALDLPITFSHRRGDPAIAA